jgi:hypothetical protein
MTDGHAEKPVADMEIIVEPESAMLRELVSYWDKKRGARFAPRRADIDPIEIPSHLSHIHMMDVLDGGTDFRYRLVGTAIVEGLGRDNTGKRLSELYGDRPEVLRRFVARFALVVNEKRPVFSRGHIWWLPDRSYRRYAGGSVPLSDDGLTVNMILSELFVL